MGGHAELVLARFVRVLESLHGINHPSFDISLFFAFSFSFFFTVTYHTLHLPKSRHMHMHKRRPYPPTNYKLMQHTCLQVFILAITHSLSSLAHRRSYNKFAYHGLGNVNKQQQYDQNFCHSRMRADSDCASVKEKKTKIKKNKKMTKVMPRW